MSDIEPTEKEVKATIARAVKEVRSERERMEKLGREPESSLDIINYEDRKDELYWDDGVIRWKNSDSIPPYNLLIQFVDQSDRDMDTLKKCVRTKLRENAKEIEEYKKARANRPEAQKAEEAYEMRAAFGEGETVVDVMTGETFET